MGQLNLQFVQIDSSLEINEAVVWYKMSGRWGVLQFLQKILSDVSNFTND